MARKKRDRSLPLSARASAGRLLFDNFMPHLVAQLAYRLDLDLVEKLRHKGINVTRWRILAVLAMGDGITVNQLVERAMMQQSALSRALINMETEGYIRRAPRPGDARYVEVFLAPAGRELFNSLNVLVSHREIRLLKGFSPQETATAFALIRRLSGNISR